jgi:hypothetical protein
MRGLPRFVWGVVLLAHAAGAGLWIWLRPWGFAWWDVRLWVNHIVPAAMLLAALIAIVAGIWRKQSVLGVMVMAFPAGWTAAAVVMRMIFPITGGWFWLPMLLFAAILWIAAQAAIWSSRASAPALIAMAVVGAGVGAFMISAQRASDAHTIPTGGLIPVLEEPDAKDDGRTIRVGQGVIIARSDGMIQADVGKLRLAIYPLLSLDARSPDRCWAVLPARERNAPQRELRQLITEPARARLHLTQDGDQILDVRRDGTGPISVDAWTRLPMQVYSHLNTLCEFEIAGHKKLFVAFSPCADQLIEVKPFEEHSTAAPRRAAYLDDRGMFHIVEAHFAEKGPFKELAHGPLGRSEELAMTFYDQTRPLMRIHLSDWSSQLSTALSPTAGWGLPENAIEFNLEGDASSAAASFFVSLASTSMGRGFETVGHNAGVYRNRMMIENLDSPKIPGH